MMMRKSRGRRATGESDGVFIEALMNSANGDLYQLVTVENNRLSLFKEIVHRDFFCLIYF